MTDHTKLKEQLTATLDHLNKLERTLLRMDAGMVRGQLKEAGDAIRPMLYVLRTDEENQKQRQTDSYC